MMPHKTIIVDDETHALNTLQRYIEKTPQLELTGIFENPVEALAVLSGPTPPQIALLDIDMPELTGLDLAVLADQQVEIIFTSAHEQYALEAYGLHAAGYLLKPFSFENFFKTVQKVSGRIASTAVSPPSRPLFFNTSAKGRFIKIMTEDIIYIEAMLNYIKIFTTSSDTPKVIYLSLKEAADTLGGTHLMRVSRSYVINIVHIEVVEGGTVVMDNGKRIDVGPNYRKQFYHYLALKSFSGNT